MKYVALSEVWGGLVDFYRLALFPLLGFSRPVSKSSDALSLSVFFQRPICMEEIPYSADNSDRVLLLRYALGRNLRFQFRPITIAFVSRGSITSDLSSPSSAPFLYPDLY